MVSKTGLGATIAYGDSASPEVFTAIGKVVDFGGPSESASEVDDTTLDTTGGFTESIAGLKEAGTVECTMNWGGTNQSQVFTDFDAGTQKNWKLTWPFSPVKSDTFLAWVSAVGKPTTAADSAITVAFTLQIVGAPTRVL